MKFGIGVKLVILATVVVVATAVLLFFVAKSKTEGIVLEHEILDLGDETKLRAGDLRSEIYSLRGDVEELSRARKVQQLFNSEPEVLQPADIEKFYQRNYLWMEVLAVEGGGEEQTTVVEVTRRWERDSKFTRVTRIASREKFIEEFTDDLRTVKADLQSPRATTRNRTIVSAIRRVEIAVEGSQLSERANVVWAGRQLAPADGDPTARHILIIAALDLDAPLPAAISSDGDDRPPLRAMNSDPRHLVVLANEPSEEEVAQDASGEYNHPDFSAELLTFPYDEAMQLLDPSDLVGPFTELYRKRNELLARCQAVSQEDKVEVSPRYVINYPGQKINLKKKLWYLQSTDIPTKNDTSEIPREVEEKLAEFAAAAEGKSRIGRLLGGVKNIRLLAQSKEEARQLSQEIDARLQEVREVFEESSQEFRDRKEIRVQWYSPVCCQECWVHFVLFPVQSDNSSGGQRYYGLAQAAFSEEMNADVVQKMVRSARWGVAFVLLAAGLGFVFSLFFTRPLKRITATARAVADTKINLDPADRAWHASVSDIAQRLPVKRHDEIGVLARAFSQMLDEVIEGHERLRELNAGLDRRVRERTKELEAANEELKTARDKAHELSRAKDAFLASVSHELRNPLNQVSGFCQLIELTDLDEEQRADLQKIRSAASQLLALINDILDYQKIIMGGMTLEPGDIQVHQLLHEVGDAMKFQFPENGNRLETHCGDDVGNLYADKQRVRQVLLNLTGNACKLTREGTISLRASRVPSSDGDVIQFDVVDTGRGMTPEEQSKLFNPFVKFATKQGNQSGTGLGLVICKGFCEMMHGSISVRSEFGKGSTFTVRLPGNTVEGHVVGPPSEGDGLSTQLSTSQTAAKHAEHPATPVERLEPAAPQRSWGAGPAGETLPAGSARTVLVVDDDANVREMMYRYLEMQGFRVITAADGLEGLELAKRIRPAVITLDAIMPGLDGWAVLAALRTDCETSSIPVIMVTITDNEKRGYSLGAAEFVTKPIEWERLAKILANYTGDKCNRSILVVDDEPQDREILRRNLERDGWSVLEAEHGKAALELLATERPAAILLDLMMPVMDGFEFLAEYCQLAEWLSIPVVVITAKDPSPEELARLEGSVVRVLQKGAYSNDELLHEIHRRVDKHIQSDTRETKEDHDV